MSQLLHRYLKQILVYFSVAEFVIILFLINRQNVIVDQVQLSAEAVRDATISIENLIQSNEDLKRSFYTCLSSLDKYQNGNVDISNEQLRPN